MANQIHITRTPEQKAQIGKATPHVDRAADLRAEITELAAAAERPERWRRGCCFRPAASRSARVSPVRPR